MLLNIDGTLQPCEEASELGFLGRRYIFSLGNDRRFLLRDVIWEKAPLTTERVAEDLHLELRDVRLKTYEAQRQMGDSGGKPRPFIQQEITDLRSIEETVQQIVRSGQFGRVWAILRNGCRALRAL